MAEKVAEPTNHIAPKESGLPPASLSATIRRSQDDLRRLGCTEVDRMAASQMLQRAAGIIAARKTKVLREYGLTMVQYSTLVLLLFSTHEATLLGRIAERIGVSATSITNGSVDLEARGLLRRTSSTKDRRLVHASLTDTGRDFALEVLHREDAEAFGLEDLSVAQAQQLAALLSIILG